MISKIELPCIFQIQNYLEKCWVCTKNLPDLESELSVWSFESHDSPAVMTLDLGMHSADMEGTQVLSLYCPFWMLNKTGFTLCYRVSFSHFIMLQYVRFIIEIDEYRWFTTSFVRSLVNCFV